MIYTIKCCHVVRHCESGSKVLSTLVLPLKWLAPGTQRSPSDLCYYPPPQLGCALGFLIPPWIVRNSMDLAENTRDLSIMFYGQAAITTALFFTVVFGKSREGSWISADIPGNRVTELDIWD